MSAIVLYSNAIKLKTQIYESILELKSSYQQTVAQQTSASITRLDSLINELNSVGRKQVQPEKRQMQLGRVQQLRQEWADLKNQMDDIKKQQANNIALQERQSLIGNQLVFIVNQNRRREEQTNEESSFLTMDLREDQAMDNAEARIEQYITMGRNALNELYDQRSMLKTTQKRLLDVAATLGLSSSVIKFIEQRTSADRWILLGLSIGTLIIMWAIVHYLG